MPANASPQKGLPSQTTRSFASSDTARRLIIAGGSTGGHLFPGIAVAEEFLRRNPHNRVLFAGTGRRLEREVLAAQGFRHRSLRAEGLKGRGLLNQIRSLAKIPAGLVDALGILTEFRPHLVLGMGGYSAGPVALAAWAKSIPVALHEQNRIPGMTNRLSAPLAQRVYLSYTDDAGRFNPAKVRLTGNPVRSAIIACRQAAAQATTASGGRRPFTVFVVGGSQGAHGINQAVVDCLAKLAPDDDYHFVHQTGTADEAPVRAAYQRRHRAATVRAFFNDMDQRYNQADLIICRSGATTVAELSVIGKGVIFVPYPFAADNHQVFNAQPLVDLGAAEMILEKDLTGEVLAERIAYYRASPEALTKMARRAKRLGRPDAAAAIVDDWDALWAEFHR